MKHQHFMEEKKRKQDEISRQKQEEKLKKMHEVEVKRQQAAIYKEQVRSSVWSCSGFLVPFLLVVEYWLVLVAIVGTDDTGLAGRPDGHVSGTDFFGRWPANCPTYGSTPHD